MPLRRCILQRCIHRCSILFHRRKSREVPHPVHVQVVWFVVVLRLYFVKLVAIVNVPNQKCHVNGKDDEPCYEHGNTHARVVLRCLMAIENKRIVPDQCAEYKASSVCPIKPKPTE